MDKLNQNKRKSILLIALKTIRPTKNSYSAWVIAGILGSILAILLSISTETVGAFSNSVEILNNIILAFTAMVMGAYALFQALLSDELIFRMSEAMEDENSSVLDELSNSFLGTVILYWMIVIVDSILLILLEIVPRDFMISNNLIVCNIIAAGLMFVYYMIVFRNIIEFKNYVVNIYNVFRAYNLMALLRKKREIK